MLAFSSVAQVGFILLGMSMATGCRHLRRAVLSDSARHALLKSRLFMALGALAISLRARTLDDFAGVARDAPGRPQLSAWARPASSARR